MNLLVHHAGTDWVELVLLVVVVDYLFCLFVLG